MKKTVKYSDRCLSPHAGSSTCAGCDPDFWMDDYPYRKPGEDESAQKARLKKFQKEE